MALGASRGPSIIVNIFPYKQNSWNIFTPLPVMTNNIFGLWPFLDVESS